MRDALVFQHESVHSVRCAVDVHPHLMHGLKCRLLRLAACKTIVTDAMRVVRGKLIQGWLPRLAFLHCPWQSPKVHVCVRLVTLD